MTISHARDTDGPAFSMFYRGDVTVLTVAGDLDNGTRTLLTGALVEAAAPGTPVVVDGTGITFCGASSLRQFLAAAAVAHHRGTAFVLVTRDTVVLRPLHLLGLGRHLTVTADLDGALILLGLPC